MICVIALLLHGMMMVDMCYTQGRRNERTFWDYANVIVDAGDTQIEARMN